MKKVESLEAMLTKERESLEQKTKEVDLLQEELAQKENEYFNSQKLVETKESELLDARHEVEDMKLKVDSIQFAVQEKDLELLETQRRLDEVNNEVVELQQMIDSKEDQLVQVRTELQDKEKRLQLMQDELDKMRLGRSQAESVVQKIVELTGNLIGSVEGEEFDIYNLLDDEILSTGTALESNLHKHNQLEADIDMLKESLQQKDMDLRAAYKELDAKDLELKAVLRRLDVRDKELDKLDELSIDPNDVRRLSNLADEAMATKDNNVEEVELQKCEIEHVEVEALAATTMLKKLANMAKELLRSGRTDSGTNLLAPQNANSSGDASEPEPEKKTNVILEAKKDIVGLFSLTEELVADAGINDAAGP
jgi:chromosome segregation ATPase